MKRKMDDDNGNDNSFQTTDYIIHLPNAGFNNTEYNVPTPYNDKFVLDMETGNKEDETENRK